LSKEESEEYTPRISSGRVRGGGAWEEALGKGTVLCDMLEKEREEVERLRKDNSEMRDCLGTISRSGRRRNRSWNFAWPPRMQGSEDEGLRIDYKQGRLGLESWRRRQPTSIANWGIETSRATPGYP